MVLGKRGLDCTTHSPEEMLYVEAKGKLIIKEKKKHRQSINTIAFGRG